MTVSEWAEQKRILPRELSPIPGAFKWETTPYLREIADALSDSSPIQRVVVMKAAQIGFTVSVLENWIGYIIDIAPAPSMFISGDKGTAETGIELRVDRMIESTGIQGKIFSQVEKRHNKKTGDTKSRKDFAGGFLMAIGPNSGAKLRMISIQKLMCDEVDAYPVNVGASDAAKRGVTKNEGDPIALAERRTSAFSSRRKILYGSTPLIKGSSRIEELFKMGDQRYFHVPCIHCGHMQPLRWAQIKFELDHVLGLPGEATVTAGSTWIFHGLVYRQGGDGKQIDAAFIRPAASDDSFPVLTDAKSLGRLIRDSVHYECEECGKPWKDKDKQTFLQKGEWRPSKEPDEPDFVSYHINALYSPAGMLPWETVCQEWINAQDDTTRLREFINNVLGEPFEERGEKPRAQLLENRAAVSGYQTGSLPENHHALFVTIGADVQKDRIEAEIVAWGRDRESWSIEYLTFYQADTSDQHGEAWKEFEAAIKAPHAGLETLMVLIDCGYNAPTVLDFCAPFGNQGLFPVWGDHSTGRGGKGTFRLSEVQGRAVLRVDLNTDQLKQDIYACLRIGTQNGLPPTDPLPGYCHFPEGYGGKYFDMLCSEERRIETTKYGIGRPVWYKPHGKRNEALDARVYAMGGIFVLQGLWRKEEEDKMELLGLKKEDARVSWNDFWAMAEDPSRWGA